MKYFITATGTDIGKTYVASLLCRQNGWRAAKPVASGGDGDARILNCKPLYQFAAPIAPHLAARAEGVVMDFEKIVQYCKNSGAEIIEGAGGVMSPLTETHTNLDLINALNIPVILVTGNYLGTISHTLTALGVLKGREVKIILNEVVAGVNSSEIAQSIEAFGGLKPSILGHNSTAIPHYSIAPE